MCICRGGWLYRQEPMCICVFVGGVSCMDGSFHVYMCVCIYVYVQLHGQEPHMCMYGQSSPQDT